MEQLTDAATSTRRVNDSGATPSSVKTPFSFASASPVAAQQEKPREIRERRLQVVAWILAVSSLMYLLPCTDICARIVSSVTFNNYDVVSSRSLTTLGASAASHDSFLHGVLFSGPRERDLGPDKRIPRIIHQTYKTDKIPSDLEPFVRSWKEKNPLWQYVFYNDSDCVSFIEREFPEYLPAYLSLPKNVERSDFFRYMVILRYGGVYADLDTECVVPMDDVLQAEDEMVVGWECDMPSNMSAASRHFIRRRQILQWVFAASPGHPVLRDICEFISVHARANLSSVSSNHNTLEKTGPGAWTDGILRHLTNSERNQSVRVLPQAAFGSHPSETDDIRQNSPEILVKHHFLGSWKNKNWGGKKGLKFLQSLVMGQLQTSSSSDIIKPSLASHFPVSANFTPTFTIMVHPAGDGPSEADSRMSTIITRWGAWQAGDRRPQKPRLVDVLAGSLGDVGMQLSFLDIGAGLGFFSLAAASRHHPVISFESTMSNIPLLQHSIRVNGFTDRLKLYSNVKEFRKERRLMCEASFEDHRGPKELHAAGEPSFEEMPARDCTLKIGAVRIGYSGWSMWEQLNGWDFIRESEPEIVAIEYSPWHMKSSGWEDPTEFLRTMTRMGYKELYHSGHLCQLRWETLIKHVRDFSRYERPSWCNLVPEDFEIFHKLEDTKYLPQENILFVRRR